MRVRQQWVVSCDMTKCQAQLITKSRTGRSSTREALQAGWGLIRVGKFGRKIHLCRACRETLQLEQEPELFPRVIANGDYSADHTVLARLRPRIYRGEAPGGRMHRVPRVRA
jgi:hypothetical protein